MHTHTHTHFVLWQAFWLSGGQPTLLLLSQSFFIIEQNEIFFGYKVVELMSGSLNLYFLTKNNIELVMRWANRHMFCSLRIFFLTNNENIEQSWVLYG